MNKIFTICIILALAGCAENQQDVGFGKKIDFNSGVNSKVRTVGVIESNDNDIVTQRVTDIQIIRGTDGDEFANPEFNTKSVVATAVIESGNNAMILTPPQRFMLDHKDARFIAYHPQANNLTAGVATFTIDGTKDIMVAAPQTASYDGSKNINFTFEHLLACIILNVKAVDDDTAIEYGKLNSASILGPTGAELIIDADGTTNFIKSGTPGNIYFTTTGLSISGSGSTMTLLVFPNDPGRKLEKITLGFENRAPEEYTVKTEEGVVGVPLEAGKKTYINVKVKAMEISFEVAGEDDEDVDVDPWDEDDDNEDGKGTEMPVG